MTQIEKENKSSNVVLTLYHIFYTSLFTLIFYADSIQTSTSKNFIHFYAILMVTLCIERGFIFILQKNIRLSDGSMVDNFYSSNRPICSKEI